MKDSSKRIFYIILGIIFLIIGLLALITPFTPGALLSIFIGLMFLIGKEKEKALLIFFLGEKLFKKLKIEKYLDKIHL